MESILQLLILPSFNLYLLIEFIFKYLFRVFNLDCELVNELSHSLDFIICVIQYLLVFNLKRIESCYKLSLLLFQFEILLPELI